MQEIVAKLLADCFSSEHIHYSPAVMADFASAMYAAMPTRSCPDKGETAVIALTQPMTAALCFDRVWSVSQTTPREIAYFTGTETEVRLCALTMLQLLTAEQQGHYSDDLIKNIVYELVMVAREHDKDAFMELLRTYDSEIFSRVLARAIEKSIGIRPLPMYSTAASCSQEYREGSSEAAVAILTGLRVVDELNTTWDQVLEFRQDAEARKKYQRFLHWLDSSMVGRSLSFIQQEVALRLDDYEWSLRKHGIATVIGSLGLLAEGKILAATAATYSAFYLAANETVATAGAAAAFVGSLSIHLANAALNLEETRHGAHAPVAFVHDAQIALRRTRRPNSG